MAFGLIPFPDSNPMSRVRRPGRGPTDHEAARAFAAMPGSRLLHLFHNKHELTWIKLGSAGD